MAPTEEQFRADALAFLEAHAKPRLDATTAWGEGSDRVDVIGEDTPEHERQQLEEARAWRRKLFEAGYAWITGPEQYGGAGLPLAYAHIWHSLEADFDTPPQTPFFGVALGMVAPTILAHGTDRAKELYLRALCRGDIVACQLFSEPAAGSDLAGVQARAVLDGDEWVINGQKVWTSGAHFSDIGEILCRTDPDAPKHKGLTVFIVDMDAPGVEVRPLRQITCGASFNEVFFTDVRVPGDHRLGEVNQGWSVALTTLLNERATIGAGTGSGAGNVEVHRVIEMARHFGLNEDPRVRQGLAVLYMHDAVARFTSLRAMASIKAGQPPGPELSIGKLAHTENLKRMSAVVSDILGPRLAADTGEWGTYAWTELVLGAPGLRLGGGTDEIQRNIISERVLGLPKEPAGEKR